MHSVTLRPARFPRLRAFNVGPFLLILAILGAACSSSNDDSADAGAPLPSATPVVGDQLAFSAQVTSGWVATVVDEGIKPTLAIDSDGQPAIAYLREAQDGFVAFASGANDWSPDKFIRGYFYGPLDLTFDPQGRPNIAYHDHQDESFRQELGDLVHAVRDGEWTVTTLEDDGHDGWDSAIAIGPDGTVHAAGIDPSQFNRVDGVEYYRQSDDGWEVSAIGSGPIRYEFNVSLAVAPDGDPALTFYDDTARSLMFARFDGATWIIESVASGNSGKFSSLAFDAEGRPHVTFFEELTATTGRVVHANRDDGAWTLEVVGELNAVEQGMTGARRITSLALDSSGVPHVAFSDLTTISYASRGPDGWNVTELVKSEARRLGQLVSLKLGEADIPHLAFFEVTSARPLEGIIVHLTPGG